ncbi:outer membrane lipoprotein carrier protein LolA [Halalkalibaculum sp. DA3122]|uniref:LolA family protein n=1 Tax=Halalkalibaculum sp. DA3122 TaxID=3373607 RepID=UPI003754744E
MNWMNLIDKWLLLLLTGLLLSLGATATQAQETPFDRLIGKFKEGVVFKSEFNHQYIDSYTGDTVETSGTIWVGENKYKVQNNQQTVVVDGETSRVYDKNRNRVIVSTYEAEEDDFAPSRFLNGADTTYTVENQQEKESQTLITLASADPFSVFQQVEITLAGDLTPRRVFARDQADNLITTTFGAGSFIQQEPGLFVLDYPKQAEIIDMRN